MRAVRSTRKMNCWYPVLVGALIDCLLEAPLATLIVSINAEEQARSCCSLPRSVAISVCRETRGPESREGLYMTLQPRG